MGFIRIGSTDVLNSLKHPYQLGEPLRTVRFFWRIDTLQHGAIRQWRISWRSNTDSHPYQFAIMIRDSVTGALSSIFQ